jgi:hypothetical protein
VLFVACRPKIIKRAAEIYPVTSPEVLTADGQALLHREWHPKNFGKIIGWLLLLRENLRWTWDAHGISNKDAMVVLGIGIHNFADWRSPFH